MAGFRQQVLIYEDDTALGNALKKAFEADGFVCHFTARSVEAREILAKNQVGTLIVDCLLPETSGVEFVQAIRAKFPPNMLDVILMSGIFTDANFVRESLKAVSAKHFLKKPFELTQLLSLVEKPIFQAAKVEEPMNARMALYSIFSEKKLSIRDKKKAIESLEEIYGFDLPFIYNLLVEAKISGHLNLMTEDHMVFGISFSDGNIVKVDIPDKQTSIGALLISEGYVHPEDLNVAMAEKTNLRLGDRLVANYMVSPHAISIAMTMQMNVRLSRTIVDKRVSVNFVENEVELSTPSINSELFGDFLHDWIVSKISLPWLRAQYVQWMNFSLVKTPSYRDDHPALNAAVVKVLPNLFPLINSGASFSKMVDTEKSSEETLYKAVHYLLTRGLFVFANVVVNMSPTDRLKQFYKILSQFKGMDQIETFDLINQMVAGGQGEPQSVIDEFLRFIGPPPPSNQVELLQLHQQLSDKAKSALDSIKSGNRDQLRQQKAQMEVEQKFKAGQQFDEAKNLLQTRSFRKSLELLKHVQSVDPKANHLRIYLAWAKLGIMEGQPAPAKGANSGLTEVEMEMMQVPAEERTEAVYIFVQGLVAKSKGDATLAMKYFQRAVSMDPNMIAARRENAILQGVKKEKKTDVFEKDLKDVFGSIFKKK